MKIVRAVSKDGSKIARRIGPAHFNVTTIRPFGKSANAYNAALVTRLSEDFPVAILSADGANRWSLRQLRARARHLERNGAIHERYLSALEANVIGSEGVGLQMKIRESADREVSDPQEQYFLKTLQEKEVAHAQKRGHTKCVKLFELKGDVMVVAEGSLDRYANAIIEQEWKDWGKRGNFDVTKKHSRHDWWRLSLRTSARDGDAICIRYRGYPNKWGMAWQLIEGDYVDDYYNTDLPNGNTVRMGVEIDRFRRKVAVWAFTKHPGDYGVEGMYSYDTNRYRIPIIGTEPTYPFHALHLSRSKRAEETRAVPWITPAMNDIHMLEKYEEAEVTAARAEACKHIFYERDAFTPTGEELAWAEGTNGQLVDDMEPGGATELPPGVRANVYDPKHPNSAYPDFIKSVKRKIASAVNCAYNTLFVDLESVNYSSIRAGLLDERENWKMIQSWTEDDMVRPQFEDWLEWGLLTGFLPFKMSDFDRLNAPEFKFRRWPWVDPEKDVAAAVLAIDNKLRTRSSVIADMSSEDFEDTIDELDYEAEYILGKASLRELDIPPAPPTPAGQATPKQGE